MGLVKPEYPNAIWDGLSDNIDRKDRLSNVDPNSQDYDRIAAEIISLETELDRVQSVTEGTSQTVTANTTLGVGTEFVTVNTYNGHVTITLPDAGESEGTEKHIKKIDNSVWHVIIVPGGSDTLDGNGDKTIHFQWTTCSLRAYNGSWYVI